MDGQRKEVVHCCPLLVSSVFGYKMEFIGPIKIPKVGTGVYGQGPGLMRRWDYPGQDLFA